MNKIIIIIILILLLLLLLLLIIIIMIIIKKQITIENRKRDYLATDKQPDTVKREFHRPPRIMCTQNRRVQ